MLLHQLPPHARRGGQRWSTEAELSAAVVDSLAMLTYVTLKAAGSKSAKKPKPVPRPKDSPAYASSAPPPARPGAHAPGDINAGPVQAGSWTDAALALAKVPGINVAVTSG